MRSVKSPKWSRIGRDFVSSRHAAQVVRVFWSSSARKMACTSSRMERQAPPPIWNGIFRTSSQGWYRRSADQTLSWWRIIHFDNVFDGYSFEGVPDTRVIIFKGFPVMSMMRLSTAASDGKGESAPGRDRGGYLSTYRTCSTGGATARADPVITPTPTKICLIWKCHTGSSC